MNTLSNEESEEWSYTFRFIEFEEIVGIGWYMTFGRGIPYKRKYAVRVSKSFATLYMKLRPKRQL